MGKKSRYNFSDGVVRVLRSRRNVLWDVWTKQGQRPPLKIGTAFLTDVITSLGGIIAKNSTQRTVFDAAFGETYKHVDPEQLEKPPFRVLSPEEINWYRRRNWVRLRIDTTSSGDLVKQSYNQNKLEQVIGHTYGTSYYDTKVNMLVDLYTSNSTKKEILSKYGYTTYPSINKVEKWYGEFVKEELEQEWRYIEGWEGQYQISDRSHIRNVQENDSVLVKQWLDRETKRVYVTLVDEQRTENHCVASLIIDTFFPAVGKVTRYRVNNGITGDYRVENIGLIRGGDENNEQRQANNE